MVGPVLIIPKEDSRDGPDDARRDVGNGACRPRPPCPRGFADRGAGEVPVLPVKSPVCAWGIRGGVPHLAASMAL